MIYILGGAFDPPHAGHSAIVRSILHFLHPELIIIIPSSQRDDKSYHVSDDHRLAMLRIFCEEIHGNKNAEQILTEGQKEERILIDDYFIRVWKGEMITRDVDEYVRGKYGDNICHIFGTDTISSMPDWDNEGYASRVVKKLFVPRREVVSILSSCRSSTEGSDTLAVDPFQDCVGEKNNQNLISEEKSDSHPSHVSHRLRRMLAFGSMAPFGRTSGSLGMTKKEILEFGILNFELFSDSHIPDISSTAIRKIIPEYCTIHARFAQDSRFIIPGLSRRISQYILREKLYRKPPLQREDPAEREGDLVSEQNPQSFASLQTAPLRKELGKPRILVHVCCGPDVTMPILQLREDYDIICFWYDPNIQPRSEYDKRYDAFVKVCEIENISYIKGTYDVGNFFTRIKGVEHTPERGEKCTYCYDMRMMVSAKLAARLHIPLYTSSLNTSPKKDLEKLFKMGHKYALKYGIKFLDIPFRKNGGFEKSVEYTREHDIYRQNYCGCIYSIREGGESEMKKRIVG